MMNSRRVLVLFIALALLGKSRAALGYDATLAVKHARDHWAAYDDRYNNYTSISGIAALGLVFSGTFHHGDCTNFTSQNMIAGGLNLSNGPQVDEHSSIPLLTNLVTNLEASQHIKKTARIDFRVTQTAPGWLVPGDIVTWGDDTTFYRHSGTVVGGQGNSAVVATHSNDRIDVSWNFPAVTDSDKYMVSFFHIDPIAPTIRLRTKVAGTDIPDGGFSNESGVIADAVDDAEGTGVARIIIQQTSGGVFSSTAAFDDGLLSHTATFDSLAKGSCAVRVKAKHSKPLIS